MTRAVSDAIARRPFAWRANCPVGRGPTPDTDTGEGPA